MCSTLPPLPRKPSGVNCVRIPMWRYWHTPTTFPVNFNVEEDVKRWMFDHNAVLSRLYASYDQMEYFCLPIAEMDYYDLSPTPPVFQHFDLIAGQVCQGFVGERFNHSNTRYS